MEKKSCPDVIDVDAQFDSLAHIYQAMEELHKETKMAWGKLAIPLEQVITTNNATTTDLKRWDMMISCREDGMDGRVCANWAKTDTTGRTGDCTFFKSRGHTASVSIYQRGDSYPCAAPLCCYSRTHSKWSTLLDCLQG